jgi:DNA-binding response OmpR family regulator
MNTDINFTEVGDRLLLVASDKELGDTLSQWLKEQKCRVIWAQTAREAMQMLHDVTYIDTWLDALLLDFDVSGGAGLRIIREFRSEYPWAPVVLLTSEDDISTSIWAKAQNVKIIRKPLLLWELDLWLKHLKVPA